ncbi:MAG: hypothetical protein ACJ8LN_08590 [Sulfurifustis sp.]
MLKRFEDQARPVEDEPLLAWTRSRSTTSLRPVSDDATIAEDSCRKIVCISSTAPVRRS